MTMPCGIDEQHNHPEPEPKTPLSSQERAARGGYAWLAFVGLCVGVMSWTGLVNFGLNVLGLPNWLAWMVPVSLDGAAITLAFLALRSVLAGDAAGFPRFLAVAVVGASASFNWYQAAQKYGETAAEAFFASMTILVYLMFEVVLRQLRRRNLRAAGAVEAPLPRFRFARWLWFPKRTLTAWRMAVEAGVSDPVEALELVRHRRPVVRGRVRGELKRPDRVDEPSGETLTPVDTGRDADLQPDKARAELAVVSDQADRVRQAKAILAERPDVKGPELGELVGVGRSRGYELLRLARNGDGS